MSLDAEVLLLVGLLLAAGLDLPLLLLLPSVLFILPGLPTPEAFWAPLASPGPAILGGVLYLTGLLSHRISGLRAPWEGFHALLAVIASIPLAMYASRQVEIGWIALALAPLVVGAIQSGRLGARLVDDLDPTESRLLRAPRRELLEDGTVLLLVPLLAYRPMEGGAVAALLLLLLIPGSGAALRAARFLPALLEEGFHYLTRGEPGWREGDQLPAWLKEGGDPGHAPPRGLPGALVGPSVPGRFRSGWLLEAGDNLLFVYRTPGRIWEVDITPEAPRTEGSPSWGHLAPVELEEGPANLLLPPGIYHLPGPG